MKDTVTMYLRNSSSPYTIIDSTETTIDSLTFTGSFVFRNAASGNYYYVLKHRNSIETWSKAGGEAYAFGGIMSYDFTTSSAQAYGNNLKLINGKYCTFSGDIDQDGSVDAADLSIADNDSFSGMSGYVNSDLTGDGYVDVSDVSITENNSFNTVTKIIP